MFVGHFAVALAATRLMSRPRLGTLIAASFAADIVESFPALIGVADPTRVWSHSIPATAITGAILALISTKNTRNWRDAVLIASVAVSHSAIDFITAVKEIWPGLPPAGLGLYAHPAAAAALELSVAIVGWYVWRGGLPAHQRTARPAWVMLAVLVGAEAALVAYLALFGPGVDIGALSKFVR